MTNTPLVPVFTGTISNQSIQLCNARDLHHFLESRQDFSNWIKNRIEQFGFIEGEDFSINLLKTSKGTKGGRPTTEYHLTLDMAKELAMVENNEKGREIRRYFISLERSGKQLPETLPTITADQIEKLIEKQLRKSLPNPDCLLPPDQAKEITERLDRLGKMFHPFSDQFLDVLGIVRALRGLHPNHGIERPGYRAVIEPKNK